MITINIPERRRQILYGMSFGLINRNIGQHLGIGEDTIKTHAVRLFKQIGARDRGHAVRLGFELNLLEARPIQATANVVDDQSMRSMRHVEVCWAARLCWCRVDDLSHRNQPGGIARVRELLANRGSYPDAVLLAEIARLVGLDEAGLTA